MRVIVRIYGGHTTTLEFQENKVRVKDVLNKLGALSTATIVVRKGKVLLEEELVADGDELIIYRLQDFVD